MNHLRVFESILYVKTNGKLSKLEDRTTENYLLCMVFLGYKTGSKAYRCLDPITF